MTNIFSRFNRPTPAAWFLALAAFATLIGLGMWQMERLAWKEALIARIEASSAKTPVTQIPGACSHGMEREEAQGADHEQSEVRGGTGGRPEERRQPIFTRPPEAYFVCVIAVARPNQPTLTFRGEVHGHLTFPARGTKGFGYDPIFIPQGHSETFGEMTGDAKHTISHRKRAFDAFIAWLDTQQEHAA